MEDVREFKRQSIIMTICLLPVLVLLIWVIAYNPKSEVIAKAAEVVEVSTVESSIDIYDLFYSATRIEREAATITENPDIGYLTIEYDISKTPYNYTDYVSIGLTDFINSASAIFNETDYDALRMDMLHEGIAATSLIMTKESFNKYSWSDLKYTKGIYDIVSSDFDKFYVEDMLEKGVVYDDVEYKDIYGARKVAATEDAPSEKSTVEAEPETVEMTADDVSEYVYICDFDAYYHVMDCNVIKGTSNIAEMTADDAASVGFTPCPVCIGSDPDDVGDVIESESDYTDIDRSIETAEAGEPYIEVSDATELASGNSTEGGAQGSSGVGNADNFYTYNNLDQQQTTDAYVLNTDSLKIHRSSCSKVPLIAPQNYTTSNSSIAELESQGYSRCGVCLK